MGTRSLRVRFEGYSSRVLEASMGLGLKLQIRIGFDGTLYCIDNKEPPKPYSNIKGPDDPSQHSA